MEPGPADPERTLQLGRGSQAALAEGPGSAQGLDEQGQLGLGCSHQQHVFCGHLFSTLPSKTLGLSFVLKQLPRLDSPHFGEFRENTF